MLCRFSFVAVDGLFCYFHVDFHIVACNFVVFHFVGFYLAFRFVDVIFMHFVVVVDVVLNRCRRGSSGSTGSSRAGMRQNSREEETLSSALSRRRTRSWR